MASRNYKHGEATFNARFMHDLVHNHNFHCMAPMTGEFCHELMMRTAGNNTWVCSTHGETHAPPKYLLRTKVQDTSKYDISMLAETQTKNIICSIIEALHKGLNILQTLLLLADNETVEALVADDIVYMLNSEFPLEAYNAGSFPEKRRILATHGGIAIRQTVRITIQCRVPRNVAGKVYTITNIELILGAAATPTEELLGKRSSEDSTEELGAKRSSDSIASPMAKIGIT